MLRYMLIYGLISGAIVIGVMTAGMSMASETDKGSASQLFGYLIMLVALSVIFFAIKNYRDKQLGGVIRFKTAAALGLGVAAFAGLAYVIGWEIFLLATDYAFIDEYTTGVIEAKRAAGMSGAELDALIANMEKLRVRYNNPIFRVPMTFTEIFPVGLIITLVSAALLRNEKFLPARR